MYGFAVNPMFANYMFDYLSTIQLGVALKVGEKKQGYARKNDVPLIVDIRDLWPDIFLDRFKKMGMHGLGKMVLARDFMLLVSLLKRADGLIAMSKGILQWGLDKIGRSQGPFDKVFYLGYKVDSKKPVASNKVH